jgi:3-deoxy-D-manno-octulosonate 8-phosphate phosphatase (KDO 8-P phosphatase)
VKRVPVRIAGKARKIKLLLLDVDGVLTDGAILLDGDGKENKRFHVLDGLGIKLLQSAGIRVALLTSRSSAAVRRRARELGISLLFERATEKLESYRELKKRLRLADGEIAYAGDDLTDWPVLKRVGLSLSVRNGWEGLRGRVDYVTSRNGGEGAVREIAELILRAQKKWKRLAAEYDY